MNMIANSHQICIDISLGLDDELIRFGDLGLIFKVTTRLKLSAISHKSVSTFIMQW